jgi:hypothetical protein
MAGLWLLHCCISAELMLFLLENLVNGGFTGPWRGALGYVRRMFNPSTGNMVSNKALSL